MESESMESFSVEDLEALTIEEESFAEFAEEVEDLEAESLEDLEYSESSEMVGQEALPLALLGKFAARYLLRILLKLAQRIVTRIAANASIRKRFVDAVKKGGRPAFNKLFCQVLCNSLPKWMRPLCRRLCPIVVNKIAPIASRKLGLGF